MPDFQRFPWKHCLIKYELYINVFISLICLFSVAVSLRKLLAHFLFMRSNGNGETHTRKKNTFRVRKTTVFHIYYQIRVFQGTGENRTLPSLQRGLLEIKLTVPLSTLNFKKTGYLQKRLFCSPQYLFNLIV